MRATMTITDATRDHFTHSWESAVSFNMEHATTLMSIGQHEWPDTTPRTDHPVRFQAFLAPAPKLWKRPVVGHFFSQIT